MHLSRLTKLPPCQTDEPPVEVVMDQYRMSADQYLRVTLRSKRAFKGFLLRAESGKRIPPS